MLAQLGDLRVHYERSDERSDRRSAPDKDAIVFVHSLGADLSMFEPQATALSAAYDVIRYDIRGHGGSSLGTDSPSLDLLAEDLGHLLDHLEVRAAHLVGQSIGGMIILALAAKRSLARHTLCLFDTIGWTDDQWDVKYAARAAEVDRAGMPAVAEAVARAALGRTSQQTRPAVRQSYTERIARADATGYSWCCKSMIDFDLRPGLGRVSCAVQLLAGSEDLVTPLAHIRELSKVLTSATVREVPGAGHVPFVEVPEAATGLVREWVERHPLLAAQAS